MNKIIVLLTLHFFSLPMFSQDSNNLIDKTTENKTLDFSKVFIGEKFKTDDRTQESQRTEPIGFFGDSYQRFYIHFISVVQNTNNPLEYFVFGKTKLKDNISTFQGIIQIKEIEELIRHEYPEFTHGKINGTYSFYEDTKKNGSGKFEGIFHSYWLIDEENEVEYDAMMIGADGYSNNMFNGYWISYKTGKEYQCNWGDYRIPESGDLDMGAGEFFPNDQYMNKGWQTYLDQFGDPDKPETQKAREVENAKWW
ncbi:hypothetical protein QYS49_38610 [Marivirga salinae]|uniref:Uncharacterized protein n=1 Tax=Marivirga salinarum TaxID=3059078 RepID=A0AA51RAU6_9BACT|nr:hypothetical protein [Marivirga sp. BDSF4-3]WMN11506.1 hypothetical protein QYS49_38610 [Marivirga sp. BDSF4-3]